MMKRIVVLILNFFILPAVSYAATADYLILQDIGLYKIAMPEKMFPGEPPIGGPRTYDGAGEIAGADHFSLDHTDTTYEVMYLGGDANASPTVQVTQHSGGDSDKWLLHEVEETFQKAMTLGASYASPNPLKNINGNNLYFVWGHYKWISNYVVISIDFNDLTGTKPEPLEIVRAYLQKFPSTIPTTIVLDNAHKIQWIKDEMDRRLWLCDKWFYQLQLQKVQQGDAFQAAVKSMNVFLDYREKYFVLKAADEKNLLAAYLNTSNGTGIKAKLDEYKKWWTANKDRAISL